MADSLAAILSRLSLKEEKLPEPVLPSFDIDGLAAYVKEKDVRNIVMMVGAGASVAAGIPDFRSPGTGLYDNLQKYDLPQPEAIFTMDYFRTRPEPFFELAREMWPGNYKPTTAHCLIKLFEEKGVLRRCYTQNIDMLEEVAGCSVDKVVAAHGNFSTATCIECEASHKPAYVKDHVLSEPTRVPLCKRSYCGGVVKPDIVFFGEGLPERFFQLLKGDFAACDLLLVVGTSLQVHPFASLVEMVKKDVPRFLINREVVGRDLGMRFEGKRQYRDAFLGGDLQDNARAIAAALGWADDLAAVVADVDKRHAPTPVKGMSTEVPAEGDRAGDAAAPAATPPRAVVRALSEAAAAAATPEGVLVRGGYAGQAPAGGAMSSAPPPAPPCSPVYEGTVDLHAGAARPAGLQEAVADAGDAPPRATLPPPPTGPETPVQGTRAHGKAPRVIPPPPPCSPAVYGGEDLRPLADTDIATAVAKGARHAPKAAENAASPVHSPITSCAPRHRQVHAEIDAKSPPRVLQQTDASIAASPLMPPPPPCSPAVQTEQEA